MTIHPTHLSDPLVSASDMLLNVYVEGQIALRAHERQIAVLTNGVRLFARSDDAGVAALAITGIAGLLAKLGHA